MLRSLIFAYASVCCVHALGEGVLDVGTFTGVISGLGKMFEGVQSKDVDPHRIMGTWYQTYKAAINFDVFRTQMFCPVAYFKENPVMGEGGFTIEEAYRVISKTGPIETYKRDVTKYGPGSYWMYTEEYFYPRQFVVIDVGPNENSTDNETINTEPYEYLVATDSNRLALMVFARDPVTFYAKYDKGIRDLLVKQGFGGQVFWNAPTPIYQGQDCLWPSEQEVFARRVLRNRQQAAQQAQGGSSSSGGGAAGLLSAFNPQAAVATVQGFLGGNRPQQPVQQNFNGNSINRRFN